MRTNEIELVFHSFDQMNRNDIKIESSVLNLAIIKI